MELRERCIEKTLELLGEEGLSFTMSELAANLGVSKKTLYTVFESKEAMLIATADSCFAEIKAAEQEVLANQDMELLEKIRRLIIVLPEQYKNLNWYLMEELTIKYPIVYRYIKQRMESDWEPTLRLLEEGIEKGVLRPFSLKLFKSMVEGCMEHFLSTPDLHEQAISYTEALEQMIDILLMGVVKEDTNEVQSE